MSILDKMQNLDVRIIYLLAWIFVLFPLMFPLALPVKINREAESWYTAVKNIPDGSTVIFAPMYGPSGIAELMPMTVATLHQLWAKNVKVVAVSFWTDGPIMWNMAIRDADPAKYGKVYGKDYINLGYVPGQETAMSALAKDIPGTVARDYVENKPLGDFELGKTLKTAANVDWIITIETGTPGLPEWLRQWQAPYANIKVIAGCIGVSAGSMTPYLASGQIKALMPGLTQSAEYELKLGKPGLGLASTDAVTTSHILVLLLVLAGNVAYFVGKMGGKK